MFGLILSEPERDMALRARARERLEELDLPVTAFTEEPADEELERAEGNGLVRAVCGALLRPGTPVPCEKLLVLLDTPDPRGANAIRRCLGLQLSLLPLLREDGEIREVPGGHMLGSKLLVPRITEDDRVDMALPEGTWTDLQGFSTWSGRVTRLCSLMETPVLARQNALIPIAVSARPELGGDERVTLHWSQPEEEAKCVLGDGTSFHVSQKENGAVTCVTDAGMDWHLIVHRDGEETLVR